LWAAGGKEILFLQDTLGEENDHLFSVSLVSGRVRDLTAIRGARVDVVYTSPKKPALVKVALNARDPKVFDLYRLDLDTGALELEVNNPGTFEHFTLDPALEARGATELLPDGGTRLNVRERNGRWRPLLTAPLGETLDFVSFGVDGRTVRYASSVGFRTARLLERDLTNGKEHVLAADEQADLADVLVDPATGAVDGALFEHLRHRWVPLAPWLGKTLTALNKLAPNADVVPLPGGLDGGAPISRDLAGRWVVMAITEDRVPPRYAVYDAVKDEAKVVFGATPPAPRDVLATQEPLTIEARDGRALPSYLALPAGVQPTSLPLVLLVHGGPAWRDSWGWHPITQWLTNRGYAVLRVNYRASTGFGTDHARAGYRQFGAKMQDDLTDAVAWAVAKGYADPKRVAIMGKSYGGYAALTGAALTPDLYSCAVSYVGVPDLAALIRSFPPYWAIGLAHIHALFGNPDDPQDLVRLHAVSPINNVDRIHIPILIGQGGNDVRVKKEEADWMFDAISKQGGRATYVLYPDEGHGPAGVGPDVPANRMDWFARVEGFLAGCLGGRAEPLSGDRQAGSSAIVRETGLASARAAGH
jgi:dipeptidyl aminopeptidase/acylaminoacyl peptidase